MCPRLKITELHHGRTYYFCLQVVTDDSFPSPLTQSVKFASCASHEVDVAFRRDSVETGYCITGQSASQLTPWPWAIIEKQPVVQLLKKLTTLYGNRRFITVFSRALH
jgi:hypothetical protein